MSNVNTAKHTNQGVWVFLKHHNQPLLEGISQPDQAEIEVRLMEFFAALDEKASTGAPTSLD